MGKMSSVGFVFRRSFYFIFGSQKVRYMGGGIGAPQIREPSKKK